MRRTLLFQLAFSLAFFAFSSLLKGQTTLLLENFNDCAGLPPGWSVEILGNQQAVWYVGTNQNDDLAGESIDGTCQLQIDDDATGDGSPSFVWRATTPVFDGSQFSTVRLAVDVVFRDWNEADETFKIFLKDENGLHLLRLFDQTRSTGEHFYDYETVVADLALTSTSAQMQLVFEYDDAGGFAWWAAIDNISVVGEGAGRTNVVTQTFDDCAKPIGWETEILTGQTDWIFGLCENPGANPKSMNGTCFAFFDDDILGPDAPFSAARLKTPWFDGTAFAAFGLEADILHRYYSETLTILVESSTGDETVIASFSDDVGVEQFDRFERLEFDLSLARSPLMRVVFQFDDGQDWGWWTGIDNVKIWGEGQSNDDCGRAKSLLPGGVCEAETNRTALFLGPPAACVQKAVGGKWFDFQPAFSGVARLDSRADFNDLIEIYEGDCADLTFEKCGDRDEHGFEGEQVFFNVLAGKSYKIRLAGKQSMFGTERGAFCLSVAQAAAFPQKPLNDLCENAQPLALDGPCVAASNVWAESDGPRSSRSEKARHDVWFSFAAPADGAGVELFSNADFADVLTVFSGGCDALAEVASNELGQKIRLEDLTAGQTYFLQLAGAFATVEGVACVEAKRLDPPPPANDFCQNAPLVALGAACQTATNAGAATLAEKRPSCALDPTRDVWFRFVAPASGSAKIWTGADFPHVAAVWKGQNCSNLEEVFCIKNPLRCDGFFDVPQLEAGKIHWLQLAAFAAPSGEAAAAFCVQILDGSATAFYQPMALEVLDKCTGFEAAVIEATVSGGTQPIDYQGVMPGDTLASGSNYLLVATDGLGCQQAFSGIVGECEGAACALSLSLSSQKVSCFGLADGAVSAAFSGAQGAATLVWSWQNAATATVENLPAGAYTLTATDENGCLAVATVQIEEPKKLEATVAGSSAPTDGQSNGSIDLAATGGTAPFSFFWQNGAGQTWAIEDPTGLVAGDYSATVTDANGCSATAFLQLFGTISTDDFWVEKAVRLAPNPTAGRAFLEVNFSSQLIENEPVMVEVTTAAGQLVLPKKAFSKSIWLDLEGQPSGVFWVRIFSGERVWARRLVVAR